MANEARINFISVKGPELLNMVFLKECQKHPFFWYKVLSHLSFCFLHSTLEKASELFDSALSEQKVPALVLFFSTKLMLCVHDEVTELM